MPRSKTATDCDVFAVISFAIKRPVQPPPMMATSTGLRLVMREPRFCSPLSLWISSHPYCHRETPLSRVTASADLLWRVVTSVDDFSSGPMRRTALTVGNSNRPHQCRGSGIGRPGGSLMFSGSYSSYGTPTGGLAVRVKLPENA